MSDKSFDVPKYTFIGGCVTEFFDSFGVSMNADFRALFEKLVESTIELKSSKRAFDCWLEGQKEKGANVTFGSVYGRFQAYLKPVYHNEDYDLKWIAMRAYWELNTERPTLFGVLNAVSKVIMHEWTSLRPIE